MKLIWSPPRFYAILPVMQTWLDRISPRLNILWRGEWPRHYVEPARSLYDHELVLVTKGRFLLRVEQEQWEMSAGSFAIIPPHTNHVSTTTDCAVFRSCIHFDWLCEPAPRRPICCYYPKRPAPRLIVPAPPFVPIKCHVQTFSQEGTFAALLDSLFIRWQTGESFHRSLARGVFLELLVQLLWPKSEKKRAGDAAPQLAYAAKELLDNQGQAGGSIQALLASLDYSYPHVCRLFHKNFGLTPVEYLNAQRLERAKSLLCNPRLTVAEVAYQSGFHDPGYFTKKFRQQTGITPVHYRRALD